MVYDLPTTVVVHGTEYEIRSDFRQILDICIALNDPELSEDDKMLTAIMIFYVDFENMPVEHYEDAARTCMWFINGGEDEDDANTPSGPRLVDWEQDFKLIVAPVNRVMGQEVRQMPYLHWWSFLSAYMEIGGDCTFSQVVGTRDKLARNKKMDKSEREWYRKNRKLVDMKTKYTQAEDNLTKEWT